MELVVGRVARSHGVRGELSVEVRTDEPEQRFVVGSVVYGRRPRQVETTAYLIETVREHSGRLLMAVAGVDTREAADALRGTLFVIDHSELPASDGDDEFYDHELVGLAVNRSDGTELGTVLDVVHTAGGELLSVRPAGSGTGEYLIPFVSAIVTSVDVARGTVVVDPPDGLLES